MSVVYQKQLAQFILNKLEIISPYAILAGGAPRDWYFNKEAKDFDFYFYSPADTILSVTNQLEGALGVKVVAKGFNDEMLYKNMGCIRRILGVDIEGVPCQFMQLKHPKQEFEVLGKMSCSICKVWYKGGKIRMHEDFKLSIATKLVFLSDGYKWTDPHPKKILSYMDGLNIKAASDKNTAIKHLVNKALKGIN